MELSDEQKTGLQKLITRKDVMLFMKGTPDMPMCGFSKTMIDILNKTKVDYGTFDIFDDLEVRESLKTYSSWPTYPQLYVKGELVGGLDIVKELQESGQLMKCLQP